MKIMEISRIITVWLGRNEYFIFIQNVAIHFSMQSRSIVWWLHRIENRVRASKACCYCHSLTMFHSSGVTFGSGPVTWHLHLQRSRLWYSIPRGAAPLHEENSTKYQKGHGLYRCKSANFDSLLPSLNEIIYVVVWAPLVPLYSASLLQ